MLKMQRWLFCGALSLAVLLPFCWPLALPSLQWQREALANGQYWRMLTAHLVHLDAHHLLLNLFGLLLICELLWDDLAIGYALTLLLASALGVSLLLWIYQPQLRWYAGLSGVLHGMWAGCAGAALLRKKNLFYLGALLFLAAKLVYESGLQTGNVAGNISGMPVVPVAHLYGALSGLVWLALRQLQQARRDFD